MCRWSPSCGISYALPLSVLPRKLERTDYSFVPSSLGERCFGFDEVIVVAVGLWPEGTIGMFICCSLCHVSTEYRVHYAMAGSC